MASCLSEAELIFLGTGGGRFVTITQKRWTGGIRFISDKINMHLDPGPGALIHSIEQGLDPQKINAVVVSHSHPDHYTDAEILIEAMTRGTTKKRGTLVGPHSVLFGNDVCEAAISKYHQSIPETVIEAKVGDAFNLVDVRVNVTKAVHSDPDGVGFKFNFPSAGTIGYTSDTQLFDELPRFYDGSRLLIICAMRPRNAPWKYHISTDDAVTIVKAVKPETAIITHFGAKMIFSNPFSEASYIEQQAGVRTIAAVDGMRVKFGKEIRISTKGRMQRELADFYPEA
jgi:phosphoribosyl 1,2-cyclic phosphodiesterase